MNPSEIPTRVMNVPCDIRPAQGSEAAQLSSLALQAKAHWGYDEDFMADCVEELTWTEDHINDPWIQFSVAQIRDQRVGFYAIAQLTAGVFELEALFVEPEHIGTGIGRTLMQHAMQAVREAGGHTLLIQGDPNAERFYLAAGAVRCGYRESGSIPGRMLPMFRLAV